MKRIFMLSCLATTIISGASPVQASALATALQQRQEAQDQLRAARSEAASEKARFQELHAQLQQEQKEHKDMLVALSGELEQSAQ